MTDKTATDIGREALKAYLKDCEANAIVPDVGGAWHAAFLAGAASRTQPPSGVSSAADELTSEPAHTAQAAPAAERQYINGVKTVADLVNNLLLLDQSLPIYAAQHIQIANRRRTITVPPTVSLERVKDERWIGEGDELNAAVIWTRAEAPAAGAVAGPVKWWNGCDKSVPAALRFLADHERPAGGESNYNSEHLYQLADEIERMASAPLYAAPTPAAQADSVTAPAGWVEPVHQLTGLNSDEVHAAYASAADWSHHCAADAIARKLAEKNKLTFQGASRD